MTSEAVYCHTCAAVFVAYGDTLAASRDHALDEHAPAVADDTFTRLGPTATQGSPVS